MDSTMHGHVRLFVQPLHPRVIGCPCAAHVCYVELHNAYDIVSERIERWNSRVRLHNQVCNLSLVQAARLR